MTAPRPIIPNPNRPAPTQPRPGTPSPIHPDGPTRPPNRFWSLFRVVGAVSVAIAESMSGRPA